MPERDWKFMRKIQPDLLSQLCERINKKSVALLAGEGSEQDKYLKLYKHIMKSNKIIADCFDDWRRSNLELKLAYLQRHVLLTPDTMLHLSEEMQKSLKVLQEMAEHNKR